MEFTNNLVMKPRQKLLTTYNLEKEIKKVVMMMTFLFFGMNAVVSCLIGLAMWSLDILCHSLPSSRKRGGLTD